MPWGWRLKSRQSLTCLLLLLSLADLIISLPFLQSRPQPLSVPIGPAVQAVGFLASLILSIAGRSRGQVSVEFWPQVISNLYQVTSGPQFFFWVSSSLCQALTLTSAILGPHTEGEKAICITQFLCQGQNGQLSSHPSLSDSPSLY